METTQIYALVTSLAKQSMGTADIQVNDLQGLISLGNTVLSSNDNTECFLNTLIQRVGRTDISYRRYNNRLADMVMSDLEWGAIVQKLKFEAPDAVEDPSYELEDGSTVDHYKIYKGKVNQKLFVTRAPYMFPLTTPKVQLREAFTSPEKMEQFISGRTGEVHNKAEVTLENLGRSTIANYIAEIAGTGREIKLITQYKVENPDSTITADTALLDADFLRFCVRVIKSTMDMFTEMTSGLFNEAGVTRHTPYADQRLKFTTDFIRALETASYWDAFNKEYISLVGFQKMNFWQSIKERDKISVNRASDGTAKTVDNVVGILNDRWAYGTYRIYEDIATTPVNAAGLYYNTFWHEGQLWFNDLSENAVIFTLS